MPTLTLKLKNKSLGEYQLQKGVSLTIGRREANDVVIEDPSVSGHHYKIDALGDRFLLIDLQSKNGSFVNEQLINSHWLKHEDIITIGGHSLLFNYHENEQMHDDGSDEFDETQVMDTTVKKSTILNDLDIIEIGSARLQFSIETPQKNKGSSLHAWQFIMAIKRQTSPYSITRIIDLKEGAMIEVHGRKLKAQSWR